MNMKTKEQINSKLMMVLHELESTNPHERLKNRLKIELEILYDILGEDVPEEYWERIENQIWGDENE